MSAADITTVAALVVTGLMAGLWFAWMVSVIPGTRRVDDHTYVTTMQTINRAIINPAFVIPYMGVPLLLAAAAFTQFRAGDNRRGWYLAGATMSYLIAVLGVTIGRNVPLNDALDAFRLDQNDDGAIHTRRNTYEQPWNRWHSVRTLGSIGSFVLASAAALVAADPD